MTSDPRPHVMHVITGLADGGAEAVLFRLVTDDTTHRHSVVSLSGPGKYGPLLEAEGIEVVSIGMSPSMPSPLKFARLVRLLRAARPDVVQTWMYHADLLGGLAARLARRPVVWGLHNSIVDRQSTKLRTRVIVRLNAVLSRSVPDHIVSCSEKGAAVHKDAGYATHHLTVVPNGYDLSVFRLDPEAGAWLRAEFAVPGDAPFFGCVARHDPYKDHPTLLAGFARLVETLPAARLVLVGTGMTADNPAIAGLVAQHGLGERVLLAGRRNDIPDIMNALDAHVLSSTAEAFPNVLSEAMACGTPCVATDVGDCALIVGETGETCPPSDPQALAGAMTRIIERRAAEPGLGEACRARVMQRFSVQMMVAGYVDAWKRAERRQSDE